MRPLLSLLAFGLIALGLAGCGEDKTNATGAANMPPNAEEASSPEAAILRLEEAYRARNIEAAVACKDFVTEARLMLEKLKDLPKDQIDDELIGKTAEVLELAYRAEFSQKGFPDMTGVKSAFPTKKPAGPDLVIVTEVCTYPDGGKSTQKILTVKTDKGWRVLQAVND